MSYCNNVMDSFHNDLHRNANMMTNVMTHCRVSIQLIRRKFTNHSIIETERYTEYLKKLRNKFLHLSTFHCSVSEYYAVSGEAN